MKMKISPIFIFCTLIGVSLLPSIYSDKSGNSDLFLGKYPIPKKTPDPINIRTAKAHNIYFTPFKLHGTINDKVNLTNNGKFIEVLVEQPTRCSVTGGVLGKDVYQIYKIIYFWTLNPNGIAATEIDGKGYPLEDRGIFFNRKYGSFKNALNHRDGLVELVFPVSICPRKTNVLYDNYAEQLKQIRKAGSSVEATLGDAIAWLASYIPTNSDYYAYPGSYLDQETGKRYYCATIIVIPNYPQQCLSKKQFAVTFGSFKRTSGKPLTNVASRFPQKMPVVRAKGIINYNTPR